MSIMFGSFAIGTSDQQKDKKRICYLTIPYQMGFKKQDVIHFHTCNENCNLGLIEKYVWGYKILLH